MTDTHRRILGILGGGAALARRAGLERWVPWMIDTADGAFVRARMPPLAARVEDLHLRGYLRHRGFLDYLARGMPEEPLYRSLLVDAVDSETTFVDAGAHIGTYTVLLCRRARRVVAFEPDPYNFAALKRNVVRNGCSNVEIHPKALADRAGRARFRAFRSTFSGSLAAREIEDYWELETDVVCLDDVLEHREPTPLVVKLDVEGAERLALAGMAAILRHAEKLVLFVEVNPEALAAGGSGAHELLADLRATGMKCAFVDEDAGTIVPLDEVALPRKGNVVCRRDS